MASLRLMANVHVPPYGAKCSGPARFSAWPSWAQNQAGKGRKGLHQDHVCSTFLIVPPRSFFVLVSNFQVAS